MREIKPPRFKTKGYFDRPEPFNWELLAPMAFLIFFIGVIVLL